MSQRACLNSSNYCRVRAMAHRNLAIFGIYGFADGYFALGRHLFEHYDSVSFFPTLEYVNFLKSERGLPGVNEQLTKFMNGEQMESNWSSNLKNYPVKKTHILLFLNMNTLYSWQNEHNFISQISTCNGGNSNLFVVDWDPDPNVLKIDRDFVSQFTRIFTINTKQLCVPNSTFFAVGFTDETSYPCVDDSLACDVSFVGTNLYTRDPWTNQALNRKVVLDAIKNIEGVKLHVYGNHAIRSAYPDHYKGFVSYDRLSGVFSNSLINLNISPLEDNDCKESVHCYYSERLPMIFGCEAVMMCNNDLSPMLTPDIHYIHVKNVDDVVNKTRLYLSNTRLRQEMIANVKAVKHKFNNKLIAKNLVNNMRRHEAW